VPRLYRPAALLKFQIRLEDFTVEADPAAVAQETKPYNVKLRDLISSESAQVRALGEMRANPNASPADVTKAQKKLDETRRGITTIKSKGPVSKATNETAGDPYSIQVQVVPLQMSVELNTYRSVDTLSASFPFRLLPLESQNIRSCLVEGYLTDIPPEDFMSPARWAARVGKSTILFRGFVDEWSTSNSGDDATVSIKARSLESLLVDAKIDAKSEVFTVNGDGEKISDYISSVLAVVPATRARGQNGDQLKARIYGMDPGEEPVLSRKTLKAALQTAASKNQANGGQVGAASSQGGTAPGDVAGSGNPRMTAAHEEMTAWDFIIQACTSVGLVPIYDPSAPGDNSDFILLQPPHTIYEKVQGGVEIQGGPADRFSRVIPDPNNTTGNVTAPSQIRFMVWGHNIKEFNTNRKLGRVKVQAVEVSFYNPDAKSTEAFKKILYPSKEVIASRTGPKGEGKTEEITPVRRQVRTSIRDEKILQQIAVGLYQAIGRQELVVHIITDDMMSFGEIDQVTQSLTGGSPTSDPDMLKIRHGTPVRVEVARNVRVPETGQLAITPLGDLFERRDESLRRFLIDQQGAISADLEPGAKEALVDEMVKRISNTINSAKRVDLFYVRTITHTFSADDGWSGDMELVNFTEARALPQNMNPTDKALDDQRRIKSAPQTTKEQKATNRFLDSLGRKGLKK
jgi:hypothetical protein